MSSSSGWEPGPWTMIMGSAAALSAALPVPIAPVLGAGLAGYGIGKVVNLAIGNTGQVGEWFGDYIWPYPELDYEHGHLDNPPPTAVTTGSGGISISPPKEWPVHKPGPEKCWCGLNHPDKHLDWVPNCEKALVCWCEGKHCGIGLAR